MFADSPLSRAKRMTSNNRQKSTISCRFRDKETADTQTLSRKRTQASNTKGFLVQL